MVVDERSEVFFSPSRDIALASNFVGEIDLQCVDWPSSRAVRDTACEECNSRPINNKKLSYRRVTARCVLSVVILPITTQQCRNYSYDKS